MSRAMAGNLQISLKRMLMPTILWQDLFSHVCQGLSEVTLRWTELVMPSDPEQFHNCDLVGSVTLRLSSF